MNDNQVLVGSSFSHIRPDFDKSLAIPRSPSSLSRRLRRPLSLISISGSKGYDIITSDSLSPSVTNQPPSISSSMTMSRRRASASVKKFIQSENIKGSTESSSSNINRERSTSIISSISVASSVSNDERRNSANMDKKLPPLPESSNPPMKKGHRRKSSRLESLVKWRRGNNEDDMKRVISNPSIMDNNNSTQEIKSPITTHAFPTVNTEYTTSTNDDWAAVTKYRVRGHARSSSSISGYDKRYSLREETSLSNSRSSHCPSLSLDDNECIDKVNSNITSSSSDCTLSSSPTIVWIGHEAIETPHKGAHPIIASTSRHFVFEDSFNPFDEEEDIDMRYPSRMMVRTQFW